MTGSRPTSRDAEEAWTTFSGLGRLRSVDLPCPSVTVIPGDPVDGRWVTVAAAIETAGRRHHGFATARRYEERLAIRAVAEAVERTVWWQTAHATHPPTVDAVPLDSPDEVVPVGAQVLRGWAAGDGEPFLADAVTTGSAVHDVPGEAVERGAREVEERATLVRLFHMRDLGASVDVERWRTWLPGTEIAAWHDVASGLVTAVALSPDAAPRLSLGATVVSAGCSPDDAVAKCLEEIAQTRPYARHLVNRRPADSVAAGDSLAGTESRILFWAAGPRDDALRVWDELHAGAGESGEEAGMRGRTALVDAVAVRLEGGFEMMTYARVADVSRPYAVHRSEHEKRLWRALRAPTPFAPVPLL